MIEEKLLKQHGIKITNHKLAILRLFNQHNHLDALDIVKTINIDKITISLATVYRILANFEAHKIIVKHYFNNEHAVYELLLKEQHHDHLICTQCGLIIEFVNDKIEELQLDIALKNDFLLTAHTLNIYGICKSCNQ